MEKLIIKQVNESYKTNRDIRRLNRYIVGRGGNKNIEFVRYHGSKGISKDSEAASDNMIQLLDYSRRPGQRKVYHFIFSFPDYIQDINAVRIAIEMVAEEIFDEGYCLFYGIHESKRNLHAHFSVLSVNYRTNRKWHKKKETFAMWKKGKEKLIKDILEEYHIKL